MNRNVETDGGSQPYVSILEAKVTDYLIAMATIPRHPSYRETEKGTFFIQASTHLSPSSFAKYSYMLSYLSTALPYLL